MRHVNYVASKTTNFNLWQTESNKHTNNKAFLNIWWIAKKSQEAFFNIWAYKITWLVHSIEVAPNIIYKKQQKVKQVKNREHQKKKLWTILCLLTPEHATLHARNIIYKKQKIKTRCFCSTMNMNNARHAIVKEICKIKVAWPRLQLI